MDIRYFKTSVGDKYHVYMGNGWDEDDFSLCGISMNKAGTFHKTIKPDYFDPMCENCKKILKSLKKKIDGLVK